jgi:hypothetical protein
VGLTKGHTMPTVTQVGGFIWFVFLSVCIGGFEVNVNSDE